MNEQELKQVVRDILSGLIVHQEGLAAASGDAVTGTALHATTQSVSELIVDAPDISALDLQKELYVRHPFDKAAYMEMKQATPARIGVGRAGPRPNCKTLLRFRADHAAAMDAVFNDVPEETIKEMKLLSVSSSAADRSDHLMDPNAGRKFSTETEALIKEQCKAAPQVQIVISDGLSSTAVEENIRDLLPALLQGLQKHGLSVGTNLFVKFGRVGIGDAVGGIVQSDIVIVLLGERPGLVTNSSLSSYMTYQARPGMAESTRTVVSNIYNNGTPPAEAGAYIADIAQKMLAGKASGIDLKL